MAGRYAANTDVSSAASRDEIERTLTRYGADEFAYGWNQTTATVAFQLAGRRILFRIPLPDRNDKRFTHTPSRGTPRAPKAQEAEYEQAVRQKWRALALVIKAKLEAVESEITTFEEEFLAHIQLPDGRTFGQAAIPVIAEAYRTGTMPELLPGPALR